MEEKKFPWLLRLLSVNPCRVQLLETYAIDKEKVISSFINDFSFNLIQTNGKNLPANTVPKCLEYISSQSLSLHPIKNVFFRYKGKLTEVTQALLACYISKKKSLPNISYIQVSRTPLQRFITWVVEWQKNIFKGSIFPHSASHSLIEQAQEISKEIISVIELHEKKRVSRITFEFFLDNHGKILLSYMTSCFIENRERRKSKTLSRVFAAAEISDIVNELSFPSKVLKRQPSSIQQVDRRESRNIVIQAPEARSDHSDSLEESNVSQSEEAAESKCPNDNFLELISTTRIRNRENKLYISDQEIENEKNNILEIIEKARKSRDKEKELWHKNSQNFRKINSRPSLALLIQSETRRSQSYFSKAIIPLKKIVN